VESPDRLLAKVAREQHGLFTRVQALAVGIRDRTIDSRVSRGTYERIHPEVFGFPGATVTWHRSVLAAVFSVGSPGAASHRTAAFLWGLTDIEPAEIEVTCKRHKRKHRFAFRVHESKDFLESDIVTVDGIPVTSAARTIVDLGASANFGTVARCLDAGLRSKLFTIEDVDRFVGRVARRGRTGVGIIRPLVAERFAWRGLTESPLEDLFRRIVAGSSMPMPEAQYVLSEPDGTFVGRFDFAYADRFALIELDSERWHMDPVSFQRDREKQNRANALGFTVYRFTYRQLRHGPDAVIKLLAYVNAT